MRTVRIIVSKPFDWPHGNLFGTIISERHGKKIKVELTEPLEGSTFFSDTIELQPRYESDSFKALQQLYAVIVNATLINNVTNEREPIFVGMVSYD